MNQRNQYCTFYLDDLLCGIDVADVQEILRPQTLTRVPLASRVVRGLLNLRGRIVTAVDLRTVLQLGDLPHTERSVNLIVCDGDERVSFLLDRLGEVMEFDASCLEPPPENIDRAAAALIVGAYQLADRLLLVLDADRILRHVTSLQSAALDRRAE